MSTDVADAPAPAPKAKPSLRERLQGYRPSTLTKGAAVAPLIILFGLNAVDELDREAANVLLPNIQKTFGLDIQGALTLTSIVSFMFFFIELPIAHFADRKKRTTIAAGRAAV